MSANQLRGAKREGEIPLTGHSFHYAIHKLPCFHRFVIGDKNSFKSSMHRINHKSNITET